MADITMDTIINGGQVVTRQGVQKLSIGIKDGKIAVLGPTARSTRLGKSLTPPANIFFPDWSTRKTISARIGL